MVLEVKKVLQTLLLNLLHGRLGIDIEFNCMELLVNLIRTVSGTWDGWMASLIRAGLRENRL